MAKDQQTGMSREDVHNIIYDQEGSVSVRTGDLEFQQEEAWYIQQDFNFRLCVILACLFGIAFLYSLFGAWRP